MRSSNERSLTACLFVAYFALGHSAASAGTTSFNRATTIEHSAEHRGSTAVTRSADATRVSNDGGTPTAAGSNVSAIPLTTARPSKIEQPDSGAGRPSIQVEAGFCDAISGRCTCSVAIPAPCSADERYREMVAIRQRLVELDRVVDGALVRSAAANVSIVTARVQALEESIRRQSVSVSVAEIDSVRKELIIVSSVLSSLEGKVDAKVASSLTKELDAILKQIDALEDSNPTSTQADLEKELTDLRARLARCREESLSLSASPFPGDDIAFNETNYRPCSTAAAIKIAPQVTHKWRSGMAYSWFRDAAPAFANTSKHIFELRTSQGSVAINEWLNYDNYSSARSEYLFQTRCSPYISGRKHVMLGGFFYYYDYSQKLITKMDVATCKVTRTLALPVDLSDLNKYLHKDLTYADINYDETGMYVAYTNAAASGELVITKINPINMTVIKTWETGRQKMTRANVFFVCGRMYTTDSFTARHLTGRQFGYDTNVGSEFFFDLDVESRFGGVYQLSYNPRDRMIMGVDNSHSVTYDVSWE